MSHETNITDSQSLPKPEPLEVEAIARDIEHISDLQNLPAFNAESDMAFDNLIALASLLTDTPLSAISFVDNEREWIRSTHGFEQKKFELNPAFAALTLREQEPCVVIPDTTQDERFANNPLVTGDPHIRFYAGVPMLSVEGLPLGSFSVMDRKPRQLTPGQMELLQRIARIAMDLAERERRRRILEKHVLFGEHIGLDLPGIISQIASPSGQIQSLIANLINEYNPLLGWIVARIQRFHEGVPAELIHTPEEPPTPIQQERWAKLDQTALLATDVSRQGVIHGTEAEGVVFLYAVLPLKFTNHILARVDFLCEVPKDSRFDNLFKLMLATFSNMADKAIYTEELKFYVDHDSLTGLGNRNLLISKIDKLIQLTRIERPIAILFHIRLDSLTEINDNFGYTAGDSALIEAAKRLKSLHGGKAFVARVGGDKFMVLIQDMELEKNFSAILSEVEVCVALPFRVGHDEIRISADVGCAVISDPTAHPIEMLRRAEVSLRHAAAQEAGTHRRVYTYHEQMFQERLELHKTNLLVRQAYSENRFLLRFQPVFDLTTNRLIGAETLLRLRQKDGQIVDAGQFISAIPRIRYQASIDEWVFSEFLRQFGDRSSGRKLLDIDGFMLSLNVTPVFLSVKGFAEKWLAKLSNTGISLKSIVLEVVESPLLLSNTALIENLNQVRAAGVRVSVDDFGSGYSNLRHLIQLPVDIVKFDKAFLSELTSEQSKSRTLLPSLLTLCSKLGYSSMCEGVETSEQVDFLRHTECRYVQGYFYGKAMPLSDVLALSSQNPAMPNA
jgi:diguanylate cyclase (GGDEF)-like protein